MDQIWSALSAISATIGVLIVLAGGIYARSQVNEARLSRNVSLLIEFQRQYHSLEFREFRSRLFDGEFGKRESFDPNSMTRADRHQFFMLFDYLEFLGVLVERKLIDFDLVMATFHITPPRVWHLTKMYAMQRRSEGRTLMGVHIEKLAQRYSKALPDYHLVHQDRVDPSVIQQPGTATQAPTHDRTGYKDHS